MQLTAKQLEAIRITTQRYKAGEKYTVISGYAGSGKSTVVQYIVDALELDPVLDVCYVAFTGKASTVLRQKGCPNAVTAHKLIYKSILKSDGTYVFVPRSALDDPWKLIVVDEVSMLPLDMWELIISYGIHVLACGDPGQLPPVRKDTDNHVLDKPHVFLDEIMRQAQDSEIIRLSMWVRDGKPLSTFPCENKDVMIVKPSELSYGMFDWADQIICATNKNRNDINALVRQHRGLGPEPAIGDKIICCANNWNYASSTGDWALTNGTIGYITDMSHRNFYYPRYIHEGAVPILETGILLDDGDMFERLPIDYKSIKEEKLTLTPQEIYKIKKSKKVDVPVPLEFNYGYGITCHRAQGSQWDKVLVFEENFPFEREEHIRWLYTACTRAADRLVIVRKPN